MKAGIAALAAGILGGTGVLLFLVAFGTDYWLLATETCGVFEHENSTLSTGEAEMPTETRKEILTFHHEGFFWRCWFFGEGHPETIWTFWYTSQAHPKFCMHGYLFPMPIALGPFPHPSYDTTAVYRGFWTAFILLAVAAALVGGLLLVCGIPFVSPRSYKVGGGFLLLSEMISPRGSVKMLAICRVGRWAGSRVVRWGTTLTSQGILRKQLHSAHEPPPFGGGCDGTAMVNHCKMM
ncbi:transmembrane protein 182-like isoform X2 [Manacus candei]|uniref:transmembrane protein 182-like isoform X2 n=1 Tax=Manacus candei TaxID=415023 RepID=UPI0022262BB1|nr:transmembrane protein 182-like isoform X2 [Manacus candei]